MIKREILVTLLCFATVSTILGCKKTPEGAAKAKSAAFHQPVLTALKRAGLNVGEFEQSAAKPYKAQSCVRGEVDKFDVMLCQYENEATAQEMARNPDQFVGGAPTGAVRRLKTIVLAVADRNKVDLKGKKINKLLKTFAQPISGS